MVGRLGCGVSSFGALAAPPFPCLGSAWRVARWSGPPPRPRLRGLLSSPLVRARLRVFGAVVGCRLFRLSSVFLLSFCVFCVLLFPVWGGFFGGWGVLFGGWGVWCVSFFFVALSCSLVWCRGCSLVFFGFCRGCFRWPACLAFAVRWVCGLRLRGWRVSFFGPRGCGVSGVRWCLGRSGVVLLVGRLVGRFLGRWVLGCVGALGRCGCARRSAFALLAASRFGIPPAVFLFVSFF